MRCVFFTCSIRGTTLVSSPHRTSGCASSITLMRVVPERGTPPIKMIGDCRSYSYRVPSKAATAVFREGLVGQKVEEGEEGEGGTGENL